MSDEATPSVQNNDGKPAVATEATPSPTGEQTPAATQPETVTLAKEAHDQLQKDAARAAGNQRKADLYDKYFGKAGHFKGPQAGGAEPTQEQRDQAAVEEDKKAERGLMAIAADPAYRDVLDADPTLRALFLSNPLAVLPMLAPDALDAEDAIALVKEQLTKRKPAPKPATPETTTPTADKPAAPTPSTPPAGGINPQSKERDEEYEGARGIKNTESAIAGMIGIKAKRLGGK